MTVDADDFNRSTGGDDPRRKHHARSTGAKAWCLADKGDIEIDVSAVRALS